MQWIWLLPSLGFGLFLGFGTGNWLAGWFSLATAAGYLLFSVFQHFRAPVLATEQVRFTDQRFWIGRRKLPRLEWLWKLDWYDQVFNWLRDSIERENARRAAAKMRAAELAVPQSHAELGAWVGFSGFEKCVLDLTRDGPHSLIVGPTGAGKSQLLEIMVGGLVQSHTPGSLNLALIDFKGGATLGRWLGHSTVLASATDLTGNIDEVMTWLNEQLKARELYLVQLGKSRIEDLPVAHAMPRLLVVIDELQALLRAANAHCLEDIAARGRSLGVHLLATSQSLSGLSRILQNNLGLRISVGVTDPVELAQLGMMTAPISDEIQAPEDWRVAQFRGSRGSGSFVFPIGLFSSISCAQQSGN